MSRLSGRYPVIAITGPTASGKSAVADAVALRLGTSVISADAMQVYRGMDIGTAKTPVADRPVPLLLVDVAEPDEAYSAALYQQDARKAIEDIDRAGRAPVLCGGTGLYLRAALDDMRFPHGELQDDRRSRYQELAETLGAEELHRLLAERDPESAACIHPNNVRRCVRALEMCDEGVSYARQKEGFSTPVAYYPTRWFALSMNRERLYRRIDQRVDQMIALGLVDEVKRLVDAGARDALTSRQAIGYKEIIQALDGELSMEDAIALVKQRSRRYAKRQLSWCRRDTRMVWIDMDSCSVDEAAQLILDTVGKVVC